MDNLNQSQSQEIPQDTTMIPQEPMGYDQGVEQSPIMENNPNPIQDGNPYFMGENALIKFSNGGENSGPETYWLVDKNNHTIRPFESDMALDAAFGEDLQSALQNTMTVVPPAIDSSGNITDGILNDYTILGPEYAIKEDGTSKPLEFSSHQLRGRYGKPIDENIEGLSAEALDGFLNLLKTNEKKTNISANFLNNLKKDEQLMAFFISALAYGDYTLGDIYADIARRFNKSKE